MVIRRASAPRRGMAVLVVMLVITMLTAVALFAAKSSINNTDNAGRYRQLVQTHSMSEMATTVTIGEVGRDPQSYSTRIQPQPTGAGKAKCKLTVAQRTECAQLSYEALRTLYRNGVGTAEFVVPKAAVGAPNSLGLAETRGDFFIELVGNERVPMPPGGYSAATDASNTLTFRRITILAGAAVLPESATATGVGVLAAAPTAAELALVRNMATLESTRANVIIGPIAQ